MKKNFIITAVIILLLFNGIYIFHNMPVFAFGFTDWSFFAFFWGSILLLIPLTLFFKKFRMFLLTSAWGDMLRKIFPWLFKDRLNVIDLSDYQDYAKVVRLLKISGFIGGILLAAGVANLVILPVLTSAPLLYSQSYRNLLGTVTESSFTADIEPVNLAQIRIVDEETARKLADKKIGEIPALGSEIQMGQLSLQQVKGKLYYVAPLEHRGIFQWISNNRLGSRGYVMVSAVNPQDVKLVQNINGKDIYLKYQTRGWLFDYLPRYLYFNGIVNVGMADYTFEIDDDLTPYWVVTLYKNKIGYQGADAVGVAVVNAQTGEISRYSLDNLPSWIDRVQPEQFIYNQIYNWGNYVNGFWNSVLAKTGTLKPTSQELHLIYGNDGKVYWYTGLTSSGKDDSSVGFLLVDSRTKEAKWYKVAGASEAGAKKSAEGQVQEKGYRAGYPILYNIHGTPSYIAPLKDKEGLLKAVAFISVENYNIVGVGPDIETALQAYQRSLTSKGNLYVPGHEAVQNTIQGKISRINHVVKNGESYYYFMLEGNPHIFIGTVNTAAKLPLANVGDSVTVTVSETQAATAVINSFRSDSY